MDWKIVGASVVALLLVSGLFASSLEIGDFFSSIFDKLRGWLGESPFDGFFTTPTQKPKEVSVTLKADNFELVPALAVDIKSTSTSIENFQGRINVSFSRGEMVLYNSQTGFAAKLPMEEFTIMNLSMSSVTFTDVGLDIASNINSDNASVVITDFFGKATLNSGLILEGNATSLKVKMDDLDWELR
ncbi:MAG: hypothetical protein ABIH90_02330 [Candidatus Aenigmatarchaeota archaeon]